MSGPLVAVGLLGLLATVVWYSRLLDRVAAGRRIELGSTGGLSREQVLVWLLVVMLALSLVVVGVGATPNGVTLLGSVALAMLVSDVVRRWHNRGLPPRDVKDRPA